MSLTEMSSSMSDVPTPTTGTPSIWRVLKDQRKIEIVALGLMVAGFWLAGAAGEWRLAGCNAAGIFLGLGNHLPTEDLLLPPVSAREQPAPKPKVVSPV